MNKMNYIKQGGYLIVLSLFLAGISFIKEAVFANYFGISDIADAYTIAIQIPEILFAVVWEAIHTILVPLYTERKKESNVSATRFISVFFSIILLSSILFVLFGEIISNSLLTIFAPGISQSVKELANSILKCLFPMLIFEGIERICIAVLNVNGKFAFAKIIGGVRNFFVIIFIIIFTSKFGIYATVYGMLIGIIVEALISFFITRRYEKISLTIDFKDKSIKKAMHLLVPVIIGSGVTQINAIVDKIVASFLTTGSIAAINYSTKLSNIVETILLNNIITLVYPLYSRLIIEEREDELTKAYSKTIFIGIIISVPIIFGGVFLKDELVALAFKRGSFDDMAVQVVGGLFACYLVNALFAVIRGASVRLYMASYKTHIVSINSIICVALNIILNIILSRHFGAIGLALATAISTAVACIYLLFNIKSVLPKIKFKPIVIVAIKTVVAGIVMCIVLELIKYIFSVCFININLLYVLVAIVIGGSIYVMVLMLLRVSLIKELFDFIRKNK